MRHVPNKGTQAWANAVSVQKDKEKRKFIE